MGFELEPGWEDRLKKSECPACKGTGKMDIVVGGLLMRPGDRGAHRPDCPECKGTGRKL